MLSVWVATPFVNSLFAFRANFWLLSPLVRTGLHLAKASTQRAGYFAPQLRVTLLQGSNKIQCLTTVAMQ